MYFNYCLISFPLAVIPYIEYDIFLSIWKYDSPNSKSKICTQLPRVHITFFNCLKIKFYLTFEKEKYQLLNVSTFYLLILPHNTFEFIGKLCNSEMYHEYFIHRITFVTFFIFNNFFKHNAINTVLQFTKNKLDFFFFIFRINIWNFFYFTLQIKKIINNF